MKKTVRFYELDGQGETHEIGAIVLTHGRLVAESLRLIVTRLLEEPLILYEGEEQIRIDPEQEPARFLAALPKACRGSHFWAGPVEE